MLWANFVGSGALKNSLQCCNDLVQWRNWPVAKIRSRVGRLVNYWIESVLERLEVEWGITVNQLR